MGIFHDLKAGVGIWTGTKLLHDPMTNTQPVSPITAAISLVANGGFVRIDYRWEYEHKPIDGMLVVGPQKKVPGIGGYWVDGWHMAEEPMQLDGGESEASLILNGEFQVEGHPNWGWKIVLNQPKPQSLSIIMAVISPEREESPAVDITLIRQDP